MIDPAPVVSVVIVSWNVAALLETCLHSIFRAADDVEVIVVDSASSDGTVAMLNTTFPRVSVLAQVENIGYTRGNNIGLAAARGRYLLLLNPDTVIVEDAIQKLAAYLDAHPQVGIVGPHTLNGDGTTQSTRRRFPTLLTALFESTWLQAVAPRGLLRHYYVLDQPDVGCYPVDWVQGSCLMARRAVFEQIGGLDENFIMYSEEVDWCRRAKNAGWEVHYDGEAEIIHYGGKSSEQAGEQTQIRFQQSRLRYFRKYHGVAVALVLRGFIVILFAYQWALEAAKRLLGHKPAMRRERMHTYWHVIRGLLAAS